MSHTFEVEIDGENFEIGEHTTTPNALLGVAELSPEEHYLIELRGEKQISYQGKGETEIHIHERSTFVSVFLGPTQVADAETAGAKRFAQELRALGYEVTEYGDEHISFVYRIDAGSQAGKTFDIGLVVPADFPLNAPHGPHVRPHVHPIGGKGAHPTGGIHPSSEHSKHFSDDWQHWSRPYREWHKSGKTVRDYVTFLRTLWATQ